jgi:hypothetical protein
LHIDGGEFPVRSLSGNFYYIIIRDDYRNYTWISCVDCKANFITEIKNFLEYVNTQFKSKVGIVRVDNEFTTRQWEKLFESYGIIIEGVETYFASQNGVVERANRELKDRV